MKLVLLISAAVGLAGMLADGRITEKKEKEEPVFIQEYHVEQITSFKKLEEFIGEPTPGKIFEPPALVCFVDMNENIGFYSTYLQTIKKRLKSSTIRFKLGVFLQQQQEVPFVSSNSFAGSLAFSNKTAQFRVYQSYLNDQLTKQISVGVFKEERVDLERIIQWVSLKFGVAGQGGIIQNHNHLLKRVKEADALCVYIGPTTSTIMDGPNKNRKTVAKQFANFLEATKRLFHEDQFQFGYLAIEEGGLTKPGSYRVNELEILELGDEWKEAGWNIVVFRRRNTRDKKLLQVKPAGYTPDELVKFFMKAQAIGPGPDQINFLDSMKANKLFRVKENGEENHPALIMFIDVFRDIDKESGISKSGEKVSTHERAVRLDNVNKNKAAAQGLHSAFNEIQGQVLVFTADVDDEHAYNLAKKINHNPALAQNQGEGYAPVFGIFFRNPSRGRDDDGKLFTFRLRSDQVPTSNDIVSFVDDFKEGKLTPEVVSQQAFKTRSEHIIPLSTATLTNVLLPLWVKRSSSPNPADPISKISYFNLPMGEATDKMRDVVEHAEDILAMEAIGDIQDSSMQTPCLMIITSANCKQCEEFLQIFVEAADYFWDREYFDYKEEANSDSGYDQYNIEDELDLFKLKLAEMKIKSRGDMRLPIFFHLEAHQNDVQDFILQTADPESSKIVYPLVKMFYLEYDEWLVHYTTTYLTSSPDHFIRWIKERLIRMEAQGKKKVDLRNVRATGDQKDEL